jgi:hypothetical protein
MKTIHMRQSVRGALRNRTFDCFQHEAMTAQAILPLNVEYGLRAHGGLLAPLRAALDRAQKEAREALDAMDADSKGTMAWDSCEDAIEHLELCWIYNSRSDVKENLWNAEGRRDGYDTWDPAALARHVEELRRLLGALTRLIGVLNHLSRREAEELSNPS